MDETRVRLRRVVFDGLLRDLQITAIDEQVKYLGISRPTLYRIRRGDVPSLRTAVRIARALEVPMSVLFEVEES